MVASLRLMVVDDHEAVRTALVRQLQAVPGLRVVSESGSVEQACADLVALRPDVLLLETKRSDGRGLELLSWALQHAAPARVVVLTSYPSEWERWMALQAGVADYQLKDIGTAQLAATLQQLAPVPPVSAEALAG